MKNLHFLLFAFVLFTLSSCSVITGIFKAGAITGIIAVIVVIAVIIWIISLFRGKS
ncbi:phosphatidate cytidylyltransferase [Mucilaginibacter rubeus]|uniref:Phosphatidate cytidylyltransferase n=1 Tax=Mucilaginibacter rubeus TaxID=2027860 RepID=A0A5C1HW99_9SPHI|nr:phosphatidate cytidylyltransferase [Mucilaginibacter rubeus]QEM09749.1 phosphatidate cytidylyltransferase [Mucilaginibacter rubeus]